MTEPVWALGLMSGTSLDGLDGALIRTDGVNILEFGPHMTMVMPAGLADELRALMRQEARDWLAIEQRFTEAQVPLVAQLVAQLQAEQGPDVKVSCIGFHGQTILHRPAEHITWQIGNGAWLAERCAIPVVADFRRRDVAAGGQGAPLVPLYHAALAKDMADVPLAVLNIGGISNVTLITQPNLTMPYIHALDCGPGNALLNDWLRLKTGAEYDVDGALAAQGNVDEQALETYLAHPFFELPPPKSLDRHDFTLEPVAALSAEDGAATLTAFTALAVHRSLMWLPEMPLRWLVCGGGRHNPVMMEALRRAVNAPVDPVEAVGWHGDALEAEAFAFLAVRLLRGLPISLPETTGVQRLVTGGAFYSR